MKRFDERDTLFSRMKLKPGTDRFREQYERRPEQFNDDQRLREMPPGNFADRTLDQLEIDSCFELIADLRPLIEGAPRKERIATDPAEITGRLKDIAARDGAVAGGAAALDEAFLYSFRGRGEYYGQPVDNPHPHLFIFALPMDYPATAKAPAPEESIEVTRIYARVALTGLKLAYFIRSLGYRALTHMDGRSELIFPPAAERAGLGSVGRHGLLVHPEYGSRIRLGAVTTDLPLLFDQPSRFDVKPFCERCGRCAALCPAGAIPKGARSDSPDSRWRTDHLACYTAWKEFATDCGVCLAVCPYSVPAGSEAQPGTPEFLKQRLFMQGVQKKQNPDRT